MRYRKVHRGPGSEACCSYSREDDFQQNAGIMQLAQGPQSHLLADASSLKGAAGGASGQLLRLPLSSNAVVERVTRSTATGVTSF